MSGKDGKWTFIQVPIGAVVWERVGNGTIRVLGEVLEDGERLLVAGGGEGGRGNVHFASPTNQVPYLAETGDGGEERELVLEMRPWLDVGIVSLPNAGKSQLLRAVSRATPPVEDYPFTTVSPVWAVAVWNWQDVTFGELPALIEGSHQGKGLGNGFLCCLMRSRAIVLLLDGTSSDAIGDLRTLRDELAAYDATLLDKQMIVVVNKADASETQELCRIIESSGARDGAPVVVVSALTGEGVDNLVGTVVEVLDSIPRVHGRMEVAPPPVEVRYADRGPEVRREGSVFVVSSGRAEKLIRLPDLRRFQARLQLRRELSRIGVVRALEEAGVRFGDIVRIGEIEMQWE